MILVTTLGNVRRRSHAAAGSRSCSAATRTGPPGGGHSYATDIIPAWFLIGTGFGFSLPTVIGAATTELPAKLSATGSAVVNSGRQIGGVFGTAILVLILGKAATTGDPTQYYHLWWVAAAACAAAALTSLGLTPRRQTEGRAGVIPLEAAREQ